MSAHDSTACAQRQSWLRSQLAWRHLPARARAVIQVAATWSSTPLTEPFAAAVIWEAVELWPRRA